MLAPQPSSGAPNCISGRSPAIFGSTAGVRHLGCMPPADDHMSLVAIQYERGALRLLEQRKLPLETVWLEIAGCEDCFTAIRDMTVRGAPGAAAGGRRVLGRAPLLLVELHLCPSCMVHRASAPPARLQPLQLLRHWRWRWSW